MKIEEAEAIALNYVAFLVEDENRFQQLLVQTGLTYDNLKIQLKDQAFLGFLLDFVLHDESQLLAFAATYGIAPQDIKSARRSLPGAGDDF
jgi:tricorn protease-like protein